MAPDEALRRANVKLLVMGRSEREVEGMLGAPSSRGLDEAGYLRLDYLRNVFDEERGRVFANSWIRASFELGLCLEIEVELGQEVKPEGVAGPSGEGAFLLEPGGGWIFYQKGGCVGSLNVCVWASLPSSLGSA